MTTRGCEKLDVGLTWWIKALTAKPDVLSSASRSHGSGRRELTSEHCSLTSRCAACVHTHPPPYTHTNIINKINK